MSITFVTSTPDAASSPAGAATITVGLPDNPAANDLILIIFGTKPSVANGGSIATPAGWTALGSITGAGGYGSTLGADTGNTNLFVFYKLATGSEGIGSTQVFNLTDNNITWARGCHLSNATGLWDLAMATGSDTTGGNVSITFGSDPDVKGNDFIFAGMCIPTDVTTPAQFSAEALSQTGVTFGTVTERSEPDSGTGNDIGGFIVSAPVSSGTSSAAPVMTATAGGTTTNVRGPGVFIRVREATPPAIVSLGLSHIGEGIGDTGVHAGRIPQTLHTIGQGIACELREAA